MYTFSALIKIIDINPYVAIPKSILEKLFIDSGKKTSPIPILGTINGKSFKQTLVKFRGIWRLYLNTPMRTASKTSVGDYINIELSFDSNPPKIPIPKAFTATLEKHKDAKQAFEKLPAYRQKEIVRYLGFLKTEESLKRNIQKTLLFLTGKKVNGVLFNGKKIH